MKKVIYIIIGVLVVVGIGAFVFFEQKQTKTEEQNLVKEKITYNNASSDLIKVKLPFPGAVVGKEFSVIGEARGYWFFEASFPAILIDKENNVLAISLAEAEPDPKTGEINWMTEDFVPFKANVQVPPHYIGEATLILKKDNPSGLVENNASISFPIVIEY